jgi:hypothetical protein
MSYRIMAADAGELHAAMVWHVDRLDNRRMAGTAGAFRDGLTPRLHLKRLMESPVVKAYECQKPCSAGEAVSRLSCRLRHWVVTGMTSRKLGWVVPRVRRSSLATDVPKATLRLHLAEELSAKSGRQGDTTVSWANLNWMQC